MERVFGAIFEQGRVRNFESINIHGPSLGIRCPYEGEGSLVVRQAFIVRAEFNLAAVLRVEVNGEQLVVDLIGLEQSINECRVAVLTISRHKAAREADHAVYLRKRILKGVPAGPLVREQERELLDDARCVGPEHNIILDDDAFGGVALNME